MIYDIIGDIHGNADKLINLFECLEYNLEDGVYQRPGHMAVFVGDLIDSAWQRTPNFQKFVSVQTQLNRNFSFRQRFCV